MKLTKKQQNEIEIWEYFLPQSCKKIEEWCERNDADIEKFFDWSERGKYKDEVGRYGDNSYFQKLYWGKVWAGRHMRMYEDGVLDHSMPYYCILGCGGYGPKVPLAVKDFIKKEMFKGIDSELIEQCYQEH